LFANYIIEFAPSYFRVVPEIEERVFANNKSPLRIITNMEEDLSITGSIALDLGFGGFTTPAGSLLACTLRDQITYGISYLTLCSYDDGSNVYNLKNFELIPIGRYLIEVTTLHNDMVS